MLKDQIWDPTGKNKQGDHASISTGTLMILPYFYEQDDVRSKKDFHRDYIFDTWN